MNIPDSVFSAFAAALVVVPATPARAQFSAIRQEVDFSAPDTGEIVVVQALPGFGALVQYSKIRFVARMPIPRPEEDFPRRQAEEAWFGLVRRLEKVARWDGQEATFAIAADRFHPQQSIAVLVQGADLGPILGCNKLETGTAG